MTAERFDFAFDAPFRLPLALLGVTPGNAYATLSAQRLFARFGPWSCETPIDNVIEVCRTGPYRWYTAIGPRGSFVDRGLTFGTTSAGGVCVLLREPVSGLTPLRGVRHPGLTLTVAEPDRFAAAIKKLMPAASR